MLKLRLKKRSLTVGLVLFILFSFTRIALAENDGKTQQSQTVQGIVSDVNGKPIAGANVLVKGTLVGTITDQNGHYSIVLPPNSKVLVFSFIGMKKFEVNIDNQTVINGILYEDLIGLDELIVVGYMTQKKADLTGSISTVSAEEIGKNNYSNVLQGLQGKIPGVLITGDGNPVGNVQIQIRGLTSLRSAPPLIIIDDLPSTLNLRDINPNDIESIQVLKDAASASIYGSRAASGVIIINTKKGKAGEAKISYKSSLGFSSFMNRVEMMNTQQYGQALWQGAINDGRDPNLATQIYDYDWHLENGKAILDLVKPVEWLNAQKTMHSANTDWFKEGSQLGFQNNQQLTVSNGTEKAKTLLSVDYYENKGTQIYTMLRRLTLRLNSEYNLIKDRLTIGENISIGNTKMNNQNVAHSFLTMPSIIPVYTEDGQWGGTAYGLGMDDYWNPVRMLTQNKDNYTYSDKAVGSIYASLKLFKGMSIKTLYGIDYTAGRYRTISFSYKEGGGKVDPNNAVNTYSSNDMTSTWSNTLNYQLSLGKHSLTALGGMELVRWKFEDIYGRRMDIKLEDYNYGYLSAATGTQTLTGVGDEWSLLSYFSKFNYVYDKKYLLSATLRYDGSSKFGKNNKFGFFPAVSAGWRLSEESFLKDVSLINDLKLRASWGMNGNSNIPTNALVNFYDANYTNTAYSILGNENGQLYSGYRKVQTGNDNLKWEATKQLDIGLDFGLFGGALSGSFDYFYKSTSGMLFSPSYIGAIGEGGSMWVNAADMKNTGVELILTYFSKPIGDFSYSITANISSYKNKIDNLPESVRYSYGGNGLDDDILGLSINSTYGFVANGIFQNQDEVDNSPEQQGKGVGRIKYKDLDHDGKITWEHDRTWIGRGDPDIMYGVNFDTKYKNFDFNMFWQGIAGNEVRNDWKTYSDFWNVWTQQGFNHATRILGAWTPDNPNSTIPAISLQNPNDEKRVSTYFMESGSYLKLRYIELGYTLPSKLISKLGIQSCRINFNAQNIVNLHKWWGDNAYTSIDPENPTKADEYSSPYVRPQSFMFGVDITF